MLEAADSFSWVVPIALTLITISATGLLLKGASLVFFHANRSRGMLIFSAASVVLVGSGGAFLWLSSVWGNSVVESLRRLPPEVGAEWRPWLDKTQRRVQSMETARYLFVVSGRLTHYLDDGGRLQPFLPLAEDYAKRENWLERYEQANFYLSMMRLLAIAWIVLPIFVIGAVSYVAKVVETTRDEKG